MVARTRARSKKHIKQNVEHKDSRVSSEWKIKCFFIHNKYLLLFLSVRKIKHNVKHAKNQPKKALDKSLHLPLEIFEKTLKFMKTTNSGDETESLVRNNSLKLCVSRYSHLKQSSFLRFLITAKVCLLNRDWKNLSRILRICTQDRRFKVYSSIIQVVIKNKIIHLFSLTFTILSFQIEIYFHTYNTRTHAKK